MILMVDRVVALRTTGLTREDRAVARSEPPGGAATVVSADLTDARRRKINSVP